MSSQSAPQDSASSPKATRRRGESLTRAIYLTTLRDLAENGFDKLSFDKIASSAGTGKASLYRRWSTPAQLVLAALTDPVSGFGAPAEPNTGSLRSDLVAMLNSLAGTVAEQPHGRAFLPLITQRPRNAELYASVRRLVIEPRRQQFMNVLRAAVDRGEADPGAVTPLVAAVGPGLVIQALMDHDHVSPAEVNAIVDEVLMPLITAPRR
ncbi:TetR/AcrR family transcriptional regulator [Streptomyces sp. NPDC048277]|uniref:TetR/AcrR family transcriptional regulator n=1 Tax=Streptomyces sp. NPDC048277 TaxID=3155027 RepID=UPI0033E349EF